MGDPDDGEGNINAIVNQGSSSSVASQLAVLQSRLKGFGDHAFSIAAPRLWNALLLVLRKKSCGTFVSV